MKEIQLTITAKSPLAIGNKKPGSVSEAIDYIPGSVIRGAIASKLLQQGGEPTEGDDFNTLFLGDKAAIFQNAYPAPYLLPATAVSSKAKPGFKPKGNGVFDTLIDRFCAEAYGYLFDPNCPEDGGRLEPFSGFYSQDNRKYQKKSVSKRLLTRVGINRRRATSEEEILYSIEVLNETSKILFHDVPIIFCLLLLIMNGLVGILFLKNYLNVIYYSSILIKGTQDLAQNLVTFINQNNFRLGGSASRGLGKVEIEAKLREFSPDIKTNINNFNESIKSIKGRWNQWEIFGEPSEDKSLSQRTYFTINLESDAILIDNWRRTTVISEDMLCQFAGISDENLTKDLRLETSYSSYDYISGWNSAWGLMKDIELITNKSGVYLFSIDKINQEIWIDKLQNLVTKGVGERTTEGFGKITICHPFHTIFREKAV